MTEPCRGSDSADVDFDVRFSTFAVGDAEVAAVVDAGSEAEATVELALDCGGGDEQATIIMSDVDANL